MKKAYNLNSIWRLFPITSTTLEKSIAIYISDSIRLWKIKNHDRERKRRLTRSQYFKRKSEESNHRRPPPVNPSPLMTFSRRSASIINYFSMALRVLLLSVSITKVFSVTVYSTMPSSVPIERQQSARRRLFIFLISEHNWSALQSTLNNLYWFNIHNALLLRLLVDLQFS